MCVCVCVCVCVWTRVVCFNVLIHLFTSLSWSGRSFLCFLFFFSAQTPLMRRFCLSPQSGHIHESWSFASGRPKNNRSCLKRALSHCPPLLSTLFPLAVSSLTLRMICYESLWRDNVASIYLYIYVCVRVSINKNVLFFFVFMGLNAI